MGGMIYISEEDLRKMIKDEVEKETKKRVVNNWIAYFLNQLEVPANVEGYKYLKKAIYVAIQEERKVAREITKEFYSRIAKHFGVTEHKLLKEMYCASRYVPQEKIGNKGVHSSSKNFGGPCKKLSNNEEFIATLARLVNQIVNNILD